MLRRVALVRTDVSEEFSTFFIRMTKIDELGTTQAVTSNRRTLITSQRATVASYSLSCSQFIDSCQPNDGSATVLRNVGSYKSHTG
jgi:hypothetical protein